MMKTRNIQLLLLAGFVILFGSSCSDSNDSDDKRYNWKESYTFESEDLPYGTSILFKSLKSQYGNEMWDISDDRRLDVLLDNAKDQSAYLMIRQRFTPDSSDMAAISDYAERGNDVFIAAKYINEDVVSSLISTRYDVLLRGALKPVNNDEIDPYSDEWEWNPYLEEWHKKADLNRYNAVWSDLHSSRPRHQTGIWEEANGSILGAVSTSRINGYLSGSSDSVFAQAKTYEGQTWIKSWYFFGKWELLEQITNYDSVQPVSYFKRDFAQSNHHINCIKIKHGKGHIYLMSTPLLLTNYFVHQKDHYEYVSGILANLNGDHLYWDDMTRFKPNSANYANSRTYYRFLLSNPPLKKAFYILFFTALLYLLLSLKRKQRPIPVMDQNDNTSLEYSHSIARLYFLNPNHKVILDKKKKHFQHFVNKRYGLLHHDDEEFQHKLAEKSGVNFKYIHKLYNSYKVADNQTVVKEYLLMQVAELQQHFYLNCK